MGIFDFLKRDEFKYVPSDSVSQLVTDISRYIDILDNILTEIDDECKAIYDILKEDEISIPDASKVNSIIPKIRNDLEISIGKINEIGKIGYKFPHGKTLKNWRVDSRKYSERVNAFLRHATYHSRSIINNKDFDASNLESSFDTATKRIKRIREVYVVLAKERKGSLYEDDRKQKLIKFNQKK